MSFSANSYRSMHSIHEQRIPTPPPLGAVRNRAGRTAGVTLVLLATVVPSVGSAAEQFFCTFATSPTDCNFLEQAKEQGRATIVNTARDGMTAVRLHTEPGDAGVAGSGVMERNDLYLAQPGVAAPVVFGEGEEQWWAHSILFPDDFDTPTWQMYVVFNFHHIDTTREIAEVGQANFHINFQQRTDPTEYGDLVFRGHGGEQDAGLYGAIIAPGGTAPPISKNVWYDFVYHVRWSSGSSGAFDAWVRKGNETTYKWALAHRGPTLYTDQGVYLKLANYHVPVCVDECIGTHQASSVIHDRVVLGESWQDVALVAGPLEGQYEESAASYDSDSTPSSWIQYGPETGTFSGDTIVATNEANATATFTFTGTEVTWMGVKCNICGSAGVSIDGGAATTVNTFDVTASDGGSRTSQAVYSVDGLAAGPHTMVITASGDGYIAVDGFWVPPKTSKPVTSN